MVKFITEDKSELLTAQAAQLLAVFAADNSASRKKGAAGAGDTGSKARRYCYLSLSGTWSSSTVCNSGGRCCGSAGRLP